MRPGGGTVHGGWQNQKAIAARIGPRPNNSGYRPSAYHPANLVSSCVSFGANKPPPVSASLRTSLSLRTSPQTGVAIRLPRPPSKLWGGTTSARHAPATPTPHALVGAALAAARRPAPALPGIAMLGAPRQRAGVTDHTLGRNGRGRSVRADLSPQAGLNLQAPLAPPHGSRAEALVFFPSSFSNEKEDPRAGAPPPGGGPSIPRPARRRHSAFLHSA